MLDCVSMIKHATTHAFGCSHHCVQYKPEQRTHISNHNMHSQKCMPTHLKPRAGFNDLLRINNGPSRHRKPYFLWLTLQATIL